MIRLRYFLLVGSIAAYYVALQGHRLWFRRKWRRKVQAANEEFRERVTLAGPGGPRHVCGLDECSEVCR